MHYSCGTSIQQRFCGMPQSDWSWCNGNDIKGWETWARNSTGLGCYSWKCFQNHLGHSPDELVFVFNINTPSVLTDLLPAVESASTSEMVRIDLISLHAARKSFIEAEYSEKFREHWLIQMKDCDRQHCQL